MQSRFQAIKVCPVCPATGLSGIVILVLAETLVSDDVTVFVLNNYELNAVVWCCSILGDGMPCYNRRIGVDDFKALTHLQPQL